MRYAFLLLYCALVTHLGAQQRTLHVVYTVDPHEEDDIRNGCQLDGRNIDELFTALGEIAADTEQGLAVRIHRPEYTGEAIEGFLRQLPAGPDDAVVFLFSGHGFMQPGEVSRWPLLYFCALGKDIDPEQFRPAACGMPLQRIHELLKDKGIRMSLTIGSSCNDDITVARAEQVVRRLNDHSLAEGPTGAGGALNFDLFTEYRGHILASASLPGQVAYLNDSIGSYYVDALVDVLVDGLAAQEGASWASILSKTKDVVTNVRKKEQDPQFIMFENEETRYSDPERRFADEAGVPMGIEESAYNRAFEREFDCQRAITVLPYILLNELVSRVDTEDDAVFEYEFERLRSFFVDTVLRPNHDHYTAEMADRLLEAPMIDMDTGNFAAVLDYARGVRPDLGPVLGPQVTTFIESLGR